MWNSERNTYMHYFTSACHCHYRLSADIYYMGHCDHGLSHSFNIAVGHCDWAIRGFNQAVNGFVEDGWAATVSDGMDDVSVMINESPTTKSSQIASERFLCTLGGGILCAKASMLLQVWPVLWRFLHFHFSMFLGAFNFIYHVKLFHLLTFGWKWNPECACSPFDTVFAGASLRVGWLWHWC